jgi:uroporphyrinogen-III synthase
MTRPLDGRTIALAEGRQVEDLARMLQAEGARPLRCPMVGILDAPDEGSVLQWLHVLCAGELDLVILMTGEGVRRLAGFAQRAGMHDAFVASLGRVRTLTRGPKPVGALKELGLTPSQTVTTPTTPGVLDALRGETLNGKAAGVTLAGVPNLTLQEGLTALGAQVYPVLPYVYAPATDDQKVLGLVERLAQGSVDVLVFTSAPQVDRLFDVVTAHGRQDHLRQGLARTRVAAVGPVVSESLLRHGAQVHICPEQGFVMKNLVQHIKRALGG